MAKFEEHIPFILRFETSTIRKQGESLEALFARAKKQGFADDADDSGGATMCGVTIGTYRAYCRRKGLAQPDVAALKAIPFAQWKEILKGMFWDRWKADGITSQAVADSLVDWVWISGSNGITRPQALVGVKADGVVGSVTLAAVNAQEASAFCERLRTDKIAYFHEVVTKHPRKRKFLQGWINRANAL
jgi:lysozyme family protein